MSVFDSPFNQVFRNPFGTPFNGEATGVWSPALWFMSSEQGIWLDPSDFTRYMGELGPELVTNGDFSGGTTGWTPDGTLIQTVTAGVMELTGNGGNFVSRKTVGGLTPGATYRLAGRTGIGTPGSRVRVSLTDVVGGYLHYGINPSTTLQDFSATFVPTGTSIELQLVIGDAGAYGANGDKAYFDNISVRELTAINTATMFQDSAGTTPVTAVEQPVGLALDKRLGLVEIPVTFTGFVNNTLDTLTGSGAGPWTVVEASGWGACGGNDPLTVTAGDVYKVVVDVVRNAGTISVFIGTGVGGTSQSNKPSFTTSGLKTMYLTCTSTGGSRSLSLECSSFNGSVTVVSIAKVPGNHASQATTAQKPVLSARKNLLTNTENFAAWAATNATVSQIAGVEWKVTPTATTGVHGVHISPSGAVIGAGVFVVEVKADGYTKIAIGESAQTGTFASFNLVDGTKLASPAQSKIEALPDGWYRVYVRPFLANDHAGNGAWGIRPLDDAATAASNPNTYSYLGDPAKGIRVRYPQVVRIPVEQSVLTVPAPSYQRVNTATDYDTVGFPHYLKFDGVDDNLVTTAINFTATDKMTQMLGVGNTGHGGTLGMIIESPGDYTTPGGGYGVSAVSGGFGATASGTTAVAFSGQPFPVGSSKVIAISLDIAGATPATEMAVRSNGVAASPTYSGGMGTGSFGNFILYIGRRGGTSLPFNGNLNQLVIRGAATDAAGITAGETYVAGKTGITL